MYHWLQSNEQLQGEYKNFKGSANHKNELTTCIEGRGRVDSWLNHVYTRDWKLDRMFKFSTKIWKKVIMREMSEENVMQILHNRSPGTYF